MKRWRKIETEIIDMLLVTLDEEGVVTAKELESFSECLHEAVEMAIYEHGMDEGIYGEYKSLIEKKAQKSGCKN